MLLAAAALALACAGIAGARSAVKPEPGEYSGSAGAGFPVHFSVGGDRISGLRTDFEATVDCGPPAGDPPYFTFPAMTISGDDFHGSTVQHVSSGYSPSFTIKGTFETATKVTGTIHASFTYLHNALPPCNETDKFSATRSG